MKTKLKLKIAFCFFAIGNVISFVHLSSEFFSHKVIPEQTILEPFYYSDDLLVSAPITEDQEE